MRQLMVVLSVGGVAGMASAQAVSVNVYHGSPDTPAVIVDVNEGAATLGPLSYQERISVGGLPAGSYRFRVAPEAAPMDFRIDTTQDLMADTSYSVFAFGELASIDALVAVDDNTSVSGSARFRVVHLNTAAPAVDLNVRGGGTLVDALSFGNVSGYQTVPSGTYDLDVAVDADNSVALQLDDVELVSGGVYTFVAFGGTAGRPLEVIGYVDVVPAPGAGAALALAGLFAARRRR